MARKLKSEDPAPIGHNSAAEEEANRVQFLSVLSQYDQALVDCEEPKAALKAAQKKVSTIVGLAKSIGIPKWRLEQRHNEMSRPPHENADNILAEARERRWAGIITPEQLKMYEEKTTPEEVMDASDWRSRGYKIGVLGRAANLPEGMPARFTQDFMEGHGDGRKSYLLTLAKNAPKPKGTKAADVAADAAKKLAEDPEQLDIEAAARKLKNDPKFMARGAPDADDGTADDSVPKLALLKAFAMRDPDDAARNAVIAEREAAGEVADPAEVQAFFDDLPLPLDDGFEMTDEEREAQKLRPSVQETEEAPVL